MFEESSQEVSEECKMQSVKCGVARNTRRSLVALIEQPITLVGLSNAVRPNQESIDKVAAAKTASLLN